MNCIHGNNAMKFQIAYEVIQGANMSTIMQGVQDQLIGGPKTLENWNQTEYANYYSILKNMTDSDIAGMAMKVSDCLFQRGNFCLELNDAEKGKKLVPSPAYLTFSWLLHACAYICKIVLLFLSTTVNTHIQ